jgi:ribose 5-phosphate isomerase B
MKIAIGSDHAGYELKQTLATRLRALGHEVADMGAHKLDPNDDYVDYAVLVAGAVARGEAERGVILCGSGVGVTVAANKVAGIRACVCHDTYSAHQGVEHDTMNVLVLGARVIGPALAEELVITFLNAEFSSEPRHVRRLEKVKQLEAAWAENRKKGAGR